MENNTEIQTQIEYLYHTTAKQLYSLALFAIGDGSLAEQLTLSVFFTAFKRISDKSDVSMFQKHCFRLLYLRGKKVRQKTGYPINRKTSDFTDALSILLGTENKQLAELLINLSFKERYAALLFCWQKQSLHQIAETTRLPRFVVAKRLNAAVKKSMRWSG